MRRQVSLINAAPVSGLSCSFFFAGISRIDSMIHSQEERMLSRRQLLKSIALGAVAARIPIAAAAKSLKGTAINHISYQSADYKKTRDFYIDLLGFQVSD